MSQLQSAFPCRPVLLYHQPFSCVLAHIRSHQQSALFFCHFRLILPRLFKARSTVPRDTPASSAICCIVPAMIRLRNFFIIIENVKQAFQHSHAKHTNPLNIARVFFYYNLLHAFLQAVYLKLKLIFLQRLIYFQDHNRDLHIIPGIRVIQIGCQTVLGLLYSI